MLVAGVLYGALEATLDPGVLGLRAHVQAALLAGLPALLLGALAWAGLVARRAWGQPGLALAWLERATRRDATSDREPVLTLHAVLITAVSLLSAWAWLSRRIFGVLFAMQEEELAIAAAVGVSTLMIGTAMSALWVAPRLLRRPLAWIDRRWTLPLPPSALGRYGLYVALPAFLILTALSRAYGDLLGVAGQVISIPLVLVTAGLLVRAGRPWRVSERQRRVAGASVLVGWGVAVVLGGVLRERAHGVGDRSSSPAAALGATLARALVPKSTASARVSAASELAPEAVTAQGPFFTPPGSAGRPHNIVWIIVDALRADKVGAVRAGLPLTPSLDRLAGESVVFTRAYSQGSSTSYSIPSMLAGRDVDAITWVWSRERPQLPDSELTLAERLKGHGYQTAFVLSPFINGSLEGTHQGYQIKTVVAGNKKTRKLWQTRMSPIATARAIATVGDLSPGAQPSRPFFLTVYYGEPHAPYVRHAEVAERFPDTTEASYEADVAFTDLHLGQLLDNLRIRTLLWQDTVVIVTADHGEEFGEHGRRRHGHGCYVEAVHVPLLVRIPGVVPARIDSPVALVDVVPTLIELVGAPRGGSELSGRSLLLPIHKGGQLDRTRPIFSVAAQQRADHGPTLVRAVRQDGYTLIHRREEDSIALFHTDADPAERRDLAAAPAHADRARRMLGLLEAHLTGNAGQPAPRPPP